MKGVYGSPYALQCVCVYFMGGFRFGLLEAKDNQVVVHLVQMAMAHVYVFGPNN